MSVRWMAGLRVIQRDGARRMSVGPLTTLCMGQPHEQRGTRDRP